MATNSLQTLSMVTVDSVRNLSNNIVWARLGNRDYDDQFEKAVKIGTVCSIRKPPRYQAAQDIVANIQGVVDTVATLAYGNPWNVTQALNSIELGYSFQDFSQQIGKPTAIQLANKIDQQIAAYVATNAFMYSGVPGTALTSSLTTTSAYQAVQSAKVNLDINAAPVYGDGRSLVIGSAFQGVLNTTQAALFNPASQVSDTWRSGKQGDMAGFSVYMNQLVPSITSMTYGGTWTTQTSGTPQTGSTITIAGGTGLSTFLAGTVFTVAGVYMVNPQTQQTLSTLQPFVITSVVDATHITVSPSIVASGAFQNVSQALPNSTNLTFIAASNVASQTAMAFHRDAFVFSNTTLPNPEAGTGGIGFSFTEPDTNLSISSTRYYNGTLRQHYFRQDVMAAYTMLFPQLASVIYTS